MNNTQLRSTSKPAAGPPSRFDVVVVGAGHNGLTCAAYLAKAGLKVAVVERRDIVGGAAATEEPWGEGYKVSSASYVAGLMPASLINDLGLEALGYSVVAPGPDYYAVRDDGTGFSVWGDADKTTAEIARFSSHDAAAYGAFRDHLSKLGVLAHELFFSEPPNFDPRDTPSLLKLGNKLRKWGTRDLLELGRLFTSSAADILDEWFEDDHLKGVFASQAIVGAWAGPMSPGTAYVLLHHWVGDVGTGAWGWVKGGMGALSDVIAKRVTLSGGTIITGCGAQEIIVRNGEARGVVLEDGRVLEANVVASGAHPQTTLLNLVGPSHLPAETVRDLQRYSNKSGAAKVHLALEDLPTVPAWKGQVPGDPHTGVLSIASSLEYLERAWDNAKYGEISERPFVEMLFPSVYDKTIVPQGKHMAIAFAEFLPYDADTEQGRQIFQDRVIAEIDAVAPGFRDLIIHSETIGPRGLEERFGLLGGSIFQGEMTPMQMFNLRPAIGFGHYRTPIKSLYLCGSGVHPGGGVTGVPGRNAAASILRGLSKVRGRLAARKVSSH